MRVLSSLLLACLLSVAPAALAGSVADNPDNQVTSLLSDAGAHPCSRADLTTARYGEDLGDEWWDLELEVATLSAKCRTQAPGSGSFRYQVEYVADGPDHEDNHYLVELDVGWEDGSLSFAYLDVVAETGDGPWFVSMGGVYDLVHEDDDVLQLPAPGEGPLRDVVVRSELTTEAATEGRVGSAAPADRLPTTGSATLGE